MEPDQEKIRALSAELGLPKLVARVLCARGLSDPAQASAFLNPSLADLPDPSGLCGLDDALGILLPAIDQGQTIGIAGDYDADGVSSTALLVDFLRQINAPVVWEIPHRQDDGYGFSPVMAERLATAGASLVVTVDCGISDHAGVARAHELGMKVVVSDHHALPPGDLVAANAVINPHQPGCSFPPTLAGVGLAFYLAAGLRAALRADGFFTTRTEPNLRHSLDLVALGTCADVVDLLGHNRVLVAEGGRVLGEGRREGLAALGAAARLRRPLGARDIGFGLAPRINAAGRLEHARIACELLLCRDPNQARALAQHLDGLNQQRREIEQEIVAQALDLLAEDPKAGDAACIVLGQEGWNLGVLGIVASRIKEITGRPVMLFGLDNGLAKGSGRSLPGFHMQKALSGFDELLINYGGHAMAAGATLARDDLERLAQGLDQAARASREQIAAERVLAIEAVAELAELGPQAVDPLSKLAPFGPANPEPLVMVAGAQVVSYRMLKGQHLKLTLAQGSDQAQAIAFNWKRPVPAKNQPIDLALRPAPSSFRPGTLDLVIVDLRPSQ